MEDVTEKRNRLLQKSSKYNIIKTNHSFKIWHGPNKEFINVGETNWTKSERKPVNRACKSLA